MGVQKLNYKIIATGSSGNCVLLHNNTIAMDIGVSFKKIEPYLKSIKLIFIQHVHGDHLNLKTLLRIQQERPTIRVCCGDFLTDKLPGVKNIDILELGNWYNYGEFKMSVIKGYHDVPTFGARIKIGDIKILFMTDTGTMEGITAKDYDYFFLESNYDEERATEAIKIAEENNEFCHAKGSTQTHLSHRQAWEFVEANKKEDTVWIKLHMSQKYS